MIRIEVETMVANTRMGYKQGMGVSMEGLQRSERINASSRAWNNIWRFRCLGKIFWMAHAPYTRDELHGYHLAVDNGL